MSRPQPDPLEDALLEAHERGDAGALSRLYASAADRAEANGNTDAAAFYLTHAYVFALELGLEEAHGHYTRLRKMGRED